MSTPNNLPSPHKSKHNYSLGGAKINIKKALLYTSRYRVLKTHSLVVALRVRLRVRHSRIHTRYLGWQIDLPIDPRSPVRNRIFYGSGRDQTLGSGWWVLKFQV